MTTLASMIKHVPATGIVRDSTPDLFTRNAKKHSFNGLASFGNKDTLVLLEVADTPELKAKGLMGRKYLAPFCGMLFTGLEGGAFWMKGCYIPLDIVFIENSKVSRIYTMPVDNGRNRYYYDMEESAIELPAGFCKKNGIKVGTVCKWRTW